MTPKAIRVLVAEDSITIRTHLASLINATPGMIVVGEARNGEEVVALTETLRPDVITMDIQMPRQDGLAATQQIMMRCPTPVVVVSSLAEGSVELSFQALEAGALAVVAKPPHRGDSTFEAKRQQLIRTLAAMAGVRVIRRGRTGSLSEPVSSGQTGLLSSQVAPEIVAIGASAGGPGALAALLRDLPRDLPVPVVVVQHMAHEFINGLARWLGRTTGQPVIVAADGHSLQPGVVHLSPGTSHLTVIRRQGGLAARLLAEQGNYRYQPAVDPLFLSVAATCGAAAIGLILTGMGDDGAEGLLAMRQAGARTLAQDPASATVFGMPGAAIERGAAEQVVALSHLPAAIAKLL